MTVFGPDVSRWQEGLVPPVPHGIGFGICRATNGEAIDPVVDNVIAWCKQRSVPFCAYHFVYEVASHPAGVQAEAFHRAVGGDITIPCMLDWETDSDDNCHPGRPQNATWSDVLAVAAAIRHLGHKVPLLYTGNWYWSKMGKPTMSGQGFDLVNAKYGTNATGTPQERYAAQGGDAGEGWNAYGGLTPVIWQFGDKIIWGNKTLDMNAYRGDPKVLNQWFTDWKVTPMATTFPYGYGTTTLTIEQLEAKQTVAKLHPEFWRRFKAFMEYAATEGVPIGVGTGWRIQPNPPPPGFAQPGNSNHEGFPADGKSGGAVAIDMVPSESWKWMEPKLKAYGLRSFVVPSTTGYKGTNEPWHIQPAEIPASRMRRTQPWKLETFALPDTAKPPTTVEEDDVTDAEMERIAQLAAKKVWAYQFNVAGDKSPAAAGSILGWTYAAVIDDDKAAAAAQSAPQAMDSDA